LLEFRREARAVLGFSWGCRKRGPQIELQEPKPLSVAVWDSHCEYLESRFPEWTFPVGYFQDPLQR
jgi:hypothetical protein